MFFIHITIRFYPSLAKETNSYRPSGFMLFSHLETSSYRVSSFSHLRDYKLPSGFMRLAPQRLAITIGFYATLTRETSNYHRVSCFSHRRDWQLLSGFMLLSQRIAVRVPGFMLLSPQRLAVTIGFHVFITYRD
jgi:hypothetical protein